VRSADEKSLRHLKEPDLSTKVLMGKIELDIPEDWVFEKHTASTIHIVGMDGFASPCKISREGTRITVQRNRDESGHLYLAYPFEEFGELVISTGTLPETPGPFRLMLELARGTLNRLRNQISNWQEGGLQLSVDILSHVDQSVSALCRAANTRDAKDSDLHAREALNLGMKAIFLACESFGRQVFPLRRQNINVPKHWWGCDLRVDELKVAGEALPILDIVQTQVLNARTNELGNVALGPFLDASAGGMPESWQQLEDFEERKVELIRKCRDALHNLPDNVKLLHVAGGLNGVGHRHLSYPQELQLTLDLLELVENSPHRIPTMVSFDCPWGERLAWSVGGVHPLQIADSILRRGVSVNMLGLDIWLDYWPNGSLPRDPLQWLDLVDIWSQLGLPLVIRLCAPTRNQTLVASAGQDRVINSVRESTTDDQTHGLLKTVIPMLLARPAVHGVIWIQGRDGDDRRFPSGGLFTADHKAKPIARLFGEVDALLKEGQAGG
jgi:hypothetical protein